MTLSQNHNEVFVQVCGRANKQANSVEIMIQEKSCNIQGKSIHQTLM